MARLDAALPSASSYLIVIILLPLRVPDKSAGLPCEGQRKVDDHDEENGPEHDSADGDAGLPLHAVVEVPLRDGAGLAQCPDVLHPLRVRMSQWRKRQEPRAHSESLAFQSEHR